MEIIPLRYFSSVNGWNFMTDTSINRFKEQSALYHQRAETYHNHGGQGLYISNTDIKSFTSGQVPNSSRQYYYTILHGQVLLICQRKRGHKAQGIRLIGVLVDTSSGDRRE